MTRYTNFARKRTYLEAGFNLSSEQDALQRVPNALEDTRAPAVEPQKKRQRHTTDVQANDHEQLPSDTRESGRVNPSQTTNEARASGESSKEKRKHLSGKADMKRQSAVKGFEARKQASEWRRLKRQDHRHAETICFACREKGHAARDCTKPIQTDDPQEGTKGESAKAAKNKLGKNSVGICYRCGSRAHNLSRCKEAVDRLNPLPFASCFVCSVTGHLASACPENQSKGIYPNGGCCKLCGETTHLAKDCALRKKVSTMVFLGTGREAGADEDDFHTFKRRNAEIDKVEISEDRVKRQSKIKVGMHTGIVKSFGKAPAATKAKVVHF